MAEKPNELSLRLERLESRIMLSGNVMATLLGPDLYLEGDDLDNDIEIQVVNDEVVLVGENDTTINGSDANLVIGSPGADFEGNIIVRLKDGNDRLVIREGVTVEKSVLVFAGSGNDSVGVDNANITGNLRVNGGTGDDALTIRDSSVNHLRFIGGAGADVVNIEDSQVNGRLVISTGTGNDSVVLNNVTTGKVGVVSLGAGNDELVVSNSEFSRSLIGITGAGDDFLEVDSTRVDGYSIFFTGSGADSTNLTGTNQFGKDLISISGTGDDQTAISNTSQVGGKSFVFGEEASQVPQATRDARIVNGALVRAAGAVDDVFRDPPIVPLTLTVSDSENQLIASNDISIATDQVFQVTGVTAPGSEVLVSRNGDGVFDDGSAVADENGNFEIFLLLINDESNFGLNQFAFQSTDSNGQQVVETLSVHYAVGTVVRYTTTLGDFDVELLNDDAPLAVDNFIQYLDDYENSIFHRSPGVQFVQGGGFTVDNGVIASVPTVAPIQGEFDSDNSNLRGTLSMALVPGNPNSGTSQWFFNTTDNTSLDLAEHTVFGRVIGSGITVLDAIDQVPNVDVSQLVGNSALNLIPLRDYLPFSETLTGTLSIEAGSTTVTGTGTMFTTEIPADNVISINGQAFRVVNIVSDTELVLDAASAPGNAIDNAEGRVNKVPDDSNYLFIDVDPIANENP